MIARAAERIGEQVVIEGDGSWGDRRGQIQRCGSRRRVVEEDVVALEVGRRVEPEPTRAQFWVVVSQLPLTAPVHLGARHGRHVQHRAHRDRVVSADVAWIRVLGRLPIVKPAVPLPKIEPCNPSADTSPRWARRRKPGSIAVVPLVVIAPLTASIGTLCDHVP